MATAPGGCRACRRSRCRDTAERLRWRRCGIEVDLECPRPGRAQPRRINKGRNRIKPGGGWTELTTMTSRVVSRCAGCRWGQDCAELLPPSVVPPMHFPVSPTDGRECLCDRAVARRQAEPRSPQLSFPPADLDAFSKARREIRNACDRWAGINRRWREPAILLALAPDGRVRSSGAQECIRAASKRRSIG